MKKLAIVLGIALLGTTVTAASSQAGTFSYTYLNASYVEVELDLGSLGDVDADGYTIQGVAALTENIHTFGSFRQIETEGVAVEQDAYTLGLGLNTPIADRVDVLAQIGWGYAEAEAGGFSEDDDGLIAGIGLRAMAHDMIELRAGVNHATVGEDETSFTGGVEFYFVPAFSVGGQYSYSSDVQAYTLGLTAYLDRLLQ